MKATKGKIRGRAKPTRAQREANNLVHCQKPASADSRIVRWLDTYALNSLERGRRLGDM